MCMFIVELCACVCACVCVCGFIKLHITAQSGPVYVCNYEIAHNRAVRPCYRSHFISLALILPRGDQ